jgi:hypothetical protein
MAAFKTNTVNKRLVFINTENFNSIMTKQDTVFPFRHKGLHNMGQFSLSDDKGKQGTACETSGYVTR